MCGRGEGVQVTSQGEIGDGLSFPHKNTAPRIFCVAPDFVAKTITDFNINVVSLNVKHGTHSLSFLNNRRPSTKKL